MNNMKVKVESYISNIDILSEESLNALKGGVAEVRKEEKLESESGDGAKFVCCVEIEVDL